jgi:hypothetical protein
MLQGAKLIDFTGSVKGFAAHDRCDEALINELRQGAANKVVVMIDRGENMPGNEVHLVSDHINLTGSNPLRGPNNPCGERFPVVNDIYITKIGAAELDSLPRGVAAGLKPGVQPGAEELEAVRKLGGHFCCYHLVPAMIVAAHAGWKVVGIAVPSGAKLDEKVVARLTGSK